MWSRDPGSVPCLKPGGRDIFRSGILNSSYTFYHTLSWYDTLHSSNEKRLKESSEDKKLDAVSVLLVPSRIQARFPARPGELIIKHLGD